MSRGAPALGGPFGPAEGVAHSWMDCSQDNNDFGDTSSTADVKYADVDCEDTDDVKHGDVQRDDVDDVKQARLLPSPTPQSSHIKHG